MATDSEIWDLQGRLTLAHESVAPGIDLPPLEQNAGGKTGPLRLILRDFLDAPIALRSRMSLQLDNGQTYNDRDIAELLARQDCPVK
ncbi:MAG: hypothetical protein QM690_09600 [Sphingobium sp.]